MKQKTVKPKARVHILATFNNTVVSIADMEGNSLLQESAGSLGFKGARKSTPYAATMTTEKAVAKAKSMGVKEVEVYIKGPGTGRDAALRAIRAAGLKIELIADITPIPHNGVKPRKPRRV
jgi:small subunit ribosomal protein S11